MSVSTQVGGMNYNQLSCAEQAEIDKRRKNRLAQVRQQSKEIAQQVRRKVQCEKANQLKKFQQIKQRELNEWKKRKQSEIQQEYGACLTNFGAAHMAACDASCEEDENLLQKREEHDLLAAQRGRTAMLQEQRKRDREAEERLMRKKRKQQRNASVQADLVTCKEVNRGPVRIPLPVEVENNGDDEEDEEDMTRVKTFTSKPNLHKSSVSNYNPKNFTSNSVDSSNNYESEDDVSSLEQESEEEFNQITNLLKQKCFEHYQNHPVRSAEEPIELSDSSSIENEPLPPKKTKKVAATVQLTKKGILKKYQVKTTKPKVSSSPKSKKTSEQDERVKYVDFANKYTSSYVPKDDLVTPNTETSRSNAMREAKKYQQTVVSDEILRQLAEIRSKEALEKEKTRRDYERLRIELEEVAKHEKEAKEKAAKTFNNFSTTQLNKHKQNRIQRMNQAVENALRQNIITCPRVDVKKPKETSNEVNVASLGLQPVSSVSDNSAFAGRKTNEEISNLVKVERLKDLLERINHQKKLLLREIEKSDDVPGPDLEKVIQCLQKLEKEKAALDMQQDKKQEKVELRAKEQKLEERELTAREQKLEEREKRFEDRIKEMYKAQKEFVATATNGSDSSQSSENATVVPPVEITIKVLPKSPRGVKLRKTIRCLDTLSREPGKAYPKTPKKKTKPVTGEDKIESNEIRKQPELEMVQQETQTSPPLSEAQKPILKKPQEHQQVQTNFKSNSSRQSEDSSQSISTAYQSLPDRIQVAPPLDQNVLRKPHHKLNPVLMHYITRLLGMNKNIGNQLNVETSPVETPGSSTINTSGNCSSIIQLPAFDQKRLQKLQEFINDNYSFLSEINETLERSRIHEQDEESIDKVDGIWKDVLRKKKPQCLSDKGSKRAEPSKQDQQVPSRQKQVLQSVTSGASRKTPVQQNISRPATTKHVASSQKSAQSSQQSSKQQTSQKTVKQTQQERQRTELAPRLQIPSRPQVPQITHRDMLNVTKHLESHMMNNFAEYTANCQKRIGDLAQMMERVRQEKLKLIENSLSSGEFGHFTEYKEIAVPGKPQDAPTTSASDLKESPSQREDPPSEEINNILQKQTRPFGVSKDSGISMLSRPVTSSDFRDSPDVRVTSEERENTFQPILKDIPKPPKVKVNQAVTGTSETVTDVSLMIKEQEEKEKAQRKLKPPLSLNRFSPHLEKPHEPHELSTIAEVETPSASKVNLLDRVEECGIGEIESFPNFDEYAKNLQASGHLSESLSTSACFPNLSGLKKALEQMKIKSFLAPADYGIQELSSENASGSSSASTSISDIFEELIRRKIIDKPFPDLIEDKDVSVNEQREIIIKTPENVVIEIQHEKTRKKKTSTKEAARSESLTSSDTLSGIQEIEKEPQDNLGIDLNQMGLTWATSMLKRDNESKILESSSSSTSIEKGKPVDIQKGGNFNSSGSTNSNGRPLNLRDFLARELTKKSRGEKSFSDESSLSSQFMRSLLNASSSGSKSGNSSERKLLTSTPVPTKGNSTAQQSGNEILFVGDSLSTLKGSEGDASAKSDKNKETESSSN